MPEISIITPCFNAGPYIAHTIASVRSQSLTDWEHFVVDDGSTDESAEVVRSFLGLEPRLHLLAQPNSGVCRARNAGYACVSAASKYLLFLDGDDYLEAEMLATLVAHLETHPECGMVYCKPRFINAEGRDLEDGAFAFGPRRVPHGFGVAILPETALETPITSIFTLCGLCPSVALFRRTVYDQAGEWDEAFGQLYEDTDMFLRVALRSQVHYLPLPLVHYRRHPGQATGSETTREREVAQRAKFYAKWDQIHDLPPDQQARLNKARAFRNGRIVPLFALKAIQDCLARGQWGYAIRGLGGAARRYLASFFELNT